MLSIFGLANIGNHQSLQLVWAANNWAALLHSTPMFMAPGEDEQRVAVGKLMLRLYVKFARAALDDGRRLFRCRPKLHLLVHLTEDVRASHLNPSHLSCWMDEDGIKRYMRLKRMVHVRTASVRCLERYKLGLLSRLKDALK